MREDLLTPEEIARRKRLAAPFRALGMAMRARRIAEGRKSAVDARRERGAAWKPDPEWKGKESWFRVRKPRIKRLAELRAQGKSVKEAAMVVGVSETVARRDLATPTAKAYIAEFAEAKLEELREGFDATVDATVAGCKAGVAEDMDRLLGLLGRVDKVRGFGGAVSVTNTQVNVGDPGRGRLPDELLERLLAEGKGRVLEEAEVIDVGGSDAEA